MRYKAGKRVRKTVTGRTKNDVKTKLRKLRQDLDNGVRSSATYTVGDALDDWLAGGLNGRSDRTRELYQDTVKPLRALLDDVKLRELTAGDVQQALEVLADRRVKESGQSVDHGIIPRLARRSLLSYSVPSTRSVRST